MKYLFNSINEFISPEIISITSFSLGEDKDKVSSAIQITIASLLEILTEKGENKNLELILKESGSYHTLQNTTNLFGGEINIQRHQSNIQFLHYLLKDDLTKFSSIIASSSEITEKNAKKIVSRVSSLLTAFLGEKLVSGIHFSSLIEQLDEEKINFQYYIPFEMSAIVEKSSSKAFLTQKFWLALL